MKLLLKVMKNPFSLLLGIGAGFLIAVYGKAAVPYLEPVSTIYVSLLQMCVLPIVSCAVAVNVGALARGKFKGLLKKWAIAVVLTLFVSSGIAVLLALVAKPYITPDEQTKQNLARLQGGEDEIASFFIEVSYYGDGAQPEMEEDAFTVVDFLANAIPTNIFQAFVNNDILKVLLFFGLFGIMLGFVDEEKAKAVQKGMEGIYQAFCRLVDRILIFLPLGICAMIAVQFSKEGVSGIVVSLLKLIVFIYLALLVNVAISYIVVRKSIKCTFREQARAIKRTFFVAVGTSSCIAAASVAMDDIPEYFRLEKSASRSIMPVGITVIQSGVIMCAAIAAVFGTALYHVEADFNTVLIILVGSIVYSFSIVGVPGIVAVSMLNLILSPLGIPSEMIVLIYLAIIPVIDPVAVFASVYSNIAITAAVVPRSEPLRELSENNKL